MKLTDTMKILASITKLHSAFPGIPVCTHIYLALDGQDINGVTDRELSDALLNYIAEYEIENKD
jgi:hypothetical protein